MSFWNIIELAEVGSTNALAKEHVQSGNARHGEVWQAHHQTQGRGRMTGRVWRDTAGESLLMSIVLTHIPTPAEQLQHLAALVVLGTLRQLASEHQIDPTGFELKIPNDILYRKRKICGILTEAVWQGNELRGAIMGIGTNVRQQFFSAPLENIAISLRMIGIDVTVREVRDRVLDAMARDLERYEATGLEEAQRTIHEAVRTELEEPPDFARTALFDGYITW